jgi:serine/threonine-protein kinase HipA
MAADRAWVYFGTKKAGLLTRTSGGYEFAYEADYLADPATVPVSLSLPLGTSKFKSQDLFPFFEGMLPEGWLLDLTCAAAKIDKDDRFALLLHTGRDPIGAVSVRPVEE